MTVLEQLGAYVARGGREGPSERLRQALRLHVADTVGAWIAGCGTAEGRMLAGLGPAPRESRAPGSTRDGVLDDVMTNCALARLSEIDDIHLSSATTPGALVIPAALTIGGSLALDRAAITEAILVGYEAMVRLGAALKGPSILYRGIWPTYFTAPFGVAAVAARLLGLTGVEAAQALGIALIMACPGIGRQSGATLSRWLALGHAARNGVSAALSAQAGFGADLSLLEGDFFPSIYGLAPDLAMLTDGLGESAVVVDVSFKPWCAAKQTMAATQALREIIESGISAADMTEIVVSVPGPYVGLINHGIAPGDRMSHLTSVSYQMAVSVFAPGAAFDVNQTPAEPSEEIHAFMSRVTVRADDGLLQYYPRAWPARLVVRTQSCRHERLLTHVPGDPERPFDERQVVAKFRRVVAPLVGERGAEDLAGRSLAALDEDGALASLLAEVERARTAVTGRAR